MSKRYIAFLRAINVGGHNVRMEVLRTVIEDLGFKNVETFIASGNLVFETNKSDRQVIESMIEKKLNDKLGYQVATFLRTFEELRHIVGNKAFSETKYRKAAANNIGFIKTPLNKESAERLRNLGTDIDDLNTLSTEVYWLCKKKQSQSTVSANLLERHLKIQITFRGIKTLQKLLVKYSAVNQ